MIRSLVSCFNAEQPEKENELRRNLNIERLDEELVEGCTAWLDVVDGEESEIEWLANKFQLSPAVLQDLKRTDRRQTLMVYPGYLFLSLFEPCIIQGKVEGKEIHCIITSNCFITVRSSDATSVDQGYNRMAQNPAAWQSGVAYFLYLTSQFVVDAYYPLLDRISNHLNTLEEKLLASNGVIDEKARKPVYRVKQQLINLRQMVAPQREVFSSVIGEPRLSESGDIRDLFRHLYERLLRVYDVIDSQRDLSSNVLDMMQNQEARVMGEAVNRLTIFSMIFLPLTFFIGLFDLNFAQIPEPFILPITGTAMFFLVMISMVGSAGVMFYMFRRRGWI
jgi:magnesium transporter